ncbi:MAG: SCO family protein [Acidobacteria bacterium]|jgi:protein SCO1/2|nr:SCO family protein [Acidobacteriota bacterium]
MRLRRFFVVLLAVLTVVGALGVARASAQPTGPLMVPPPGKAAAERIPLLKDVDIIQKLGNKVPMDLPFVDENGKDVKLGDYFGRRPVVLALVYYECPMLCTQVLNGVFSTMSAMPFTTGNEFDLLVISFDPGETPALALQKKNAYFERYRRPGAEKGLHFLTGRQESIKAITDAVGFKYAYDPAIDQFAHPAAVTVLTNDGEVSRYLYGIEFAPRDMRLALVDAGQGHVGSAVDQVLLYCYHYDPESGKYGFVIMNVVRLGGILTVAVLGLFIVRNVRARRPEGRAEV